MKAPSASCSSIALPAGGGELGSIWLLHCAQAGSTDLASLLISFQTLHRSSMESEAGAGRTGVRGEQ